ncbi:MAG TPA: hypothetical protein VGO66_11705 [Solirubrobacterales bacterium]|jgi:hypothetical protein|nr:hypothetical protein [Solirubrobacterales bacterium]
MKKVLLLVVALAALALPASASAYSTWTIGGSPIPEGFTIGEEYEGNFSWVEWSGGKSHPVFSCEVRLGIYAQTHEGGAQQAWVSKFERDPEKCEGYYNYNGCVINTMTNNFSSGWDVTLNAGTPRITSPSGFVEIADTFVYPGSCPTTGKSAQWGNESSPLSLVPTVDKNGNITQIALEGQTTKGIVNYTFGPLTRVSSFPYALGIK